MSQWKLTVGMEVHVELETKTKMFCSCKNDPFHSKPNTNVCPVCYGLPGALPLINKEAIAMTVKLGRALNGKIPETTFWARKNYFYPDLPKGYQISQSTEPLVRDAVVTIDGKNHRIHRIHLEEDAGKLMHAPDKSKSYVDYNRAGVPLMEIVTEPDFNSAESAKRFCQELQRIMRSLKLSSADMEKGQMRCEANISVSQTEELGTKVEVKNINSFRSVERAIAYEFERQTKALDAGESLVQETRTWNDTEGKTIPMRSKETSADYRYFPEPDLPRVSIPQEEGGGELLPEQQRQKLTELGIPKELIQPVIDKHGFEVVLELSQISAEAASDGAKVLVAVPEFLQLPFSEQEAVLLLKKDRGFTSDAIKEVIRTVSREGTTVADVVEESSVDIAALSEEVISANPKLIEEYKAGKEAVINALIGQVMAKTKGRANIQEVRQTLLDHLAK